MERQTTIMIKPLNQNKMKQTAVEFMVEEFKDTILKEYGEGRFLELIEQAKDMEKEQLKQLMWDLTEIDMAEFNKGLIIDDRFDTYWNETFKSE